MHLDIWHLTPTPHFCHSILFRRQKLHLQFEKIFCFCIIQNARRCNRLSWIRRRMSISKEILAFPDLKIKDRKTKEEFHKFLGKSHQHLLSAFESCFWKAGHYYLCVCVTVSDFSREIESQKTTSGGELSTAQFEVICKWKRSSFIMSSMGYNDARLANSTTGIYLQRSFNIEPPSARFMPGVGRAKNYSERLRMGKDCDEVYPGIIIGKKAPFSRSLQCQSLPL